jgi:hypothetical protein
MLEHMQSPRQWKSLGGLVVALALVTILATSCKRHEGYMTQQCPP